MRSSKMERDVYDILLENGFNFKEEYSFPDLVTKKGIPLRFDFAVFDDYEKIDFLIECQGRQHYTPVSVYGGARGFRKQRYNDDRKKKYCLQHSINLVCIPYWDEDKIDIDYILRAAGQS